MKDKDKGLLVLVLIGIVLFVVALLWWGKYAIQEQNEYYYDLYLKDEKALRIAQLEYNHAERLESIKYYECDQLFEAANEIRFKLCVQNWEVLSQKLIEASIELEAAQAEVDRWQ